MINVNNRPEAAVAKRIVQLSEHYLFETLGLAIKTYSWLKEAELPHYLRERYTFFETALLGQEIVLMVDRGALEQPVAAIAKQCIQVQSRMGVEVVYVCRAASAYTRRRLIQEKLPFIIPGNQLYLPALGIDLREHLRQVREKKPCFSPATQAVVLYILWRRETGTVTPSKMAARLGYSIMTMTRAFNELEDSGVGEHEVRGKERQMHFTSTGRALWEAVVPQLTTPVKKKMYLSAFAPEPPICLAGQSALARYSMLEAPPVPAYAVYTPAGKEHNLQESAIQVAVPEPGDVEIQIWKYAPEKFAKDGFVDRLSLFLSLRDEPDERVQSALETLLEEMPW